MIRKLTSKKDSKNWTIVALCAAILLLAIAQGVSLWYITKLHSYYFEDSSRSLSALINSSEESRYKHPIIDVSENRVYIPEARIYLPLNDITRELRYDESFSFKGSERIYFSTNATVGSQTTEDDPSCDKVVTLAKPAEPQTDSSYSLSGLVSPTKDGLTDVYTHADCKIYYGNIKIDLAEAVKQLQNY